MGMPKWVKIILASICLSLLWATILVFTPNCTETGIVNRVGCTLLSGASPMAYLATIILVALPLRFLVIFHLNTNGYEQLLGRTSFDIYLYVGIFLSSLLIVCILTFLVSPLIKNLTAKSRKNRPAKKK